MNDPADAARSAGPGLKVLVTGTVERSAQQGILRALAESDRIGRHSLTDLADETDLVIFVEPGGPPQTKQIMAHPLYAADPTQCMVYSICDRPDALLPGLYAGIRRSQLDSDRHKGAAYLNLKNAVAPAVDAAPGLLFSFLGNARNAAVRRRILELRHPKSIVEDTSDYRMFQTQRNVAISDPTAVERQRERYAAVMLESKFVLCPRGSGPSSFRLFEAMHAGRAPVILSDEWVPPTGPDWDGFSIRIPEAEAGRVPQILERYEDAWQAMGLRARAAWEEWFGPGVLFHRLVENFAALMLRRRYPAQVAFFRRRASLIAKVRRGVRAMRTR